MGSQSKSRVNYVDNLRIFLTGLVILHHFAITYGASGGWYYKETEAGFPEVIPFTLFVATNQAFFMGMFFFIAAYFILPSLNKKRVFQFSKDRLIRLGIPTLLFFFFLHPLTVFIRNKYIHGEAITLGDYLFKYKIFGFGPMWFVEALLIFTFGFLILRSLQYKPWKIQITIFPFPKTRLIILFAILVGLGQFIIRIWLPVGWTLGITNFQLGHFLQYISLFVLGILAWKNQWLDAITPKMGWNWFLFVHVFLFIIFPLVFFFGGAVEGNVEPFVGGFHWQNLAYAVWEQLVGFGMIVALFGIFKSKWNTQGVLAKKLSLSSYAVYVFHPPVIVLISALFFKLEIHPFFKFILLAPIALILCFLVGHLVKNMPLLKRVF